MNRQRQRIMNPFGGRRRRAVLSWPLLFRRLGLGSVFAVGVSLAVLCSGSPAQAQTITATRFSISIDGVDIAVFSGLQGIISEIETQEFRLVGDGSFEVQKAPGKFSPPSVTLKGGMTGSDQIWAWHEAVRTGQIGARRSAFLTGFNTAGQPVVRYFLEKAWPSRVDLGALRAGALALIESVTFRCEHISRVAPK